MSREMRGVSAKFHIFHVTFPILLVGGTMVEWLWLYLFNDSSMRPTRNYDCSSILLANNTQWSILAYCVWDVRVCFIIFYATILLLGSSSRQKNNA